MDLNSREKYITGLNSDLNSMGSSESLVTSELRALKAQYADPTTLCFKLMVDYSKPYGLFADKSYVNSASAYLKRIGEDLRYEMLQKFIENFKNFLKYYDFLFLTCDGVDEIVNHKAGDMFKEEESKITFSIRETADMMVQSLLTTYRHIWYDDVRQVEVLPANLRRFDASILIYSAGYFNMALYDILENNDLVKNVNDEKVFPTIKKLSDKYFVIGGDSDSYNFNHHLVILGDASFNNEESGKSFFASLNNEMNDDFVKNTLVLNFRFATYKGIFNNIFGDVDFVKALALVAAQNQASNKVKMSFADKLKKSVTGAKSNLGSFFKDAGKAFGTTYKQEVDSLKKKPSQYTKSLVGKNTAIGNALEVIGDPATMAKIAKFAFEQGVAELENQIIYSNANKLQNMVTNAIDDGLSAIYANELSNGKNSTNKPGVVETPGTTMRVNQTIEEIEYTNKVTNKNISLERSNIYTRSGF